MHQIITQIIENGCSYDEYIKIFEKEIGNLNSKEAEQKKLNYHRTLRLHKTLQISELTKALIKRIENIQLWMIITETWCGDSAQNIPIIAELAKLNPLIELKIILRDINLNIMDHFLTNNSKSIPKLVAFDKDGNQLFQWGPRPKEAQSLVLNARENQIPKDEYMVSLHKWYASDRGKTTEQEIYDLLKETIIAIHS
ncbi:MAG: thioredoxin family protein [Ignavibacteria bacterium]|nr:thioredoxin family protein [Ignavibacteria bacterium]